ncbi:unnamed protein product [Diabrotica balteata]|uniref:Uncharacterized protein n=1 Tax=Diabrotica balteata TaxID=107213 RepID=A0A9N9T5Q9_DIABA|nr:unnamed protein product [Diabrotica balteata]
MGDTIRQYDERSSDSEPFPVSESEYEPSEYSIESRESPTDRAEDVASTSNYVPSLLEEENGMPKSKGKKRIRNELQWKRNIRKRNKTAGQEYISVKGNIVPAKTFVAKDCMCLKKCHAKFSQERREALFKNFYALESHDLQTAFIYGQIRVQVKERSYSTQNIKKKENARYYFLSDERGKECQVCKEFFKLSLGVSDGRITRALATKKTTGTPRTDGRGKTSSANKTSEVKIEGVKNFINKFPVYDSHYSREKNPARQYLSPDLDITKLFNLYKAEVPNNNVSIFLFRRIFNQDFNLSFHPPISDSCRKCDAFNVKIKAAIANNEECHIIQAEQELHQRKAEAARQVEREVESPQLQTPVTHKTGVKLKQPVNPSSQEKHGYKKSQPQQTEIKLTSNQKLTHQGTPKTGNSNKDNTDLNIANRTRKNSKSSIVT